MQYNVETITLDSSVMTQENRGNSHFILCLGQHD